MLEHRQHDDPVFEFSRIELRPGDALELRPVFLEIAEGLLLRREGGRKSAHLAACAEREEEGDGATAVRFDSRHDPHSLACDRPLSFGNDIETGYCGGFLLRFAGGAGNAV